MRENVEGSTPREVKSPVRASRFTENWVSLPFFSKTI